jgi:hypothetical protein
LRTQLAKAPVRKPGAQVSLIASAEGLASGSKHTGQRNGCYEVPWVASPVCSKGEWVGLRIPVQHRPSVGQALGQCFPNCVPRTTGGPRRLARWSAGGFGRKGISKIISDNRRIKIHPYMSVLTTFVTLTAGIISLPFT